MLWQVKNVPTAVAEPTMMKAATEGVTNADTSDGLGHNPSAALARVVVILVPSAVL